MKAFFYLFLFFLFLTPLASAQTVSVGDYSTVVDSHLTVPINISDAESITGGVVNISFDPSIVFIREVTAGDFGTPMPNINNSNGWVKIVAARIDAVNKNQAVLANIVFKGFLPGQTNVDFTYASLNNETGSLITPAVSSGSITITKDVVEHPYVHLKALTSIKTVDNINASYSIGIFNGQNNESTFDLTVLNHNTATVAVLNQSTISIPPLESREVTLNVTDETPGEYAVSVRATSRNNSDVTGEVSTKTIVQESFNINMTSLEGTKTSIGANITYLLTIQNNQKNKDTLILNLSGVDPSWISFDTVHQLGSGEQKTISIKISIPGTASAGNFTLIISATSSNVGTIRNTSLPLVVQNGPIMSGLVPLDNSYIGSDDVIFTWITNINSTTQVILNQSGIETTYMGDESICHLVVVENLTRNQWYTYRVISNTSHGSTESEERSFYIDNGVTFEQRIYDFNIERDYDQRVTVTVRNTDSIAHEILLNVNSTNPELIAGFIGEGSIDETITLAPDETKDVILALHAQDAAQQDYYLSLNLTTDDNITDNAIANIHVSLPNIDLRFEELSIDPLTLTKTIRLTNHGDTVTDLNIYGNGGLKGNVTFQPTITHGYLRSGQSVTFEAMPMLSLDFIGMNGPIVAEAAGVKMNLSVNYTLPEGMNVYFGTVPNVTVEFSDYFDNDDSPNTNPQDDMLVESYLTNGSFVFFSQIIVDVFQDGEPVSNANVTLKAWDSEGKTIILNGVSDFYGKALFAVFGKADNYSYKAIVDNYKVETETRNFSVDILNPLYHVYTNNITWLNISDSNSTFTNSSETIVLGDAPYFFKANKNIIEDNETFILDMRWKLDHQKQVTIPGSTEENNIIFNTSGIPVGNYTATIVSLVNKTVSISETINITVTDINGMGKQKNYTFWVPFPVNKTHMTTLNIEHRVLSEDPKIVFDLNNVGTNNYNKFEYLFEYSILSNETKIENVSISVVTPRGKLYSNVNSISLEANVPSFINITVPVNYTDGTRIGEFNISATTTESEIYISVTPNVHYIYEKRIWVGAERGVVDLWEDKDVLISCGTGMIKEGFFMVAGPVVDITVGNVWDFFDLLPNLWLPPPSESPSPDIGGVAETTGSIIIRNVGLVEELPDDLGLLWSAGWCMKKWYDVGVEAGIYNDIRDIGFYSKYWLWNWYCTNRPTVWSYFILPSTIPQSMSPTPNIEDGYIIMRFTLPWSEGSYYPHDVDVYLNGVGIGNLSNTIPEGHYIVRFDPSILNYADSGTSTNSVTLRTKHLNGGHFVVAADMQIILPMKQAEMYVVASNQSEANEIIDEMSSVMRNKADFGIYPEDIKFSNPNPTADENIAINTTIFNFGTNGALFVSLQFFDNGAQIGENVTIGYIQPLDSIPVNITWNPSQGTHTITVRVNPDRRIREYDYSNNEASKTITVGISPDKTPPQNITDLHLQAAGTTWLNFTWTNPPDPDFNHTELYLNGTFLTNIPAPQNYYNITGLLPDTSYELSTRTVDINGNINLTWVNDTASTLPASGTTLNLYTGWNLISLPLMPEDTSITSLLSPISGNYSIVWEYNASDTSDHWKKYDPGVPFENDLINMEPGKGYWILMTSDNTLSISGTVPESTDIILKTGWNLIGYNFLDSQPIAEALSSINGNYSIVLAYNASDTADHWKKYDPSVPFENDLTIVEPGKGYWIMMTSDDILEI